MTLYFTGCFIVLILMIFDDNYGRLLDDKRYDFKWYEKLFLSFYFLVLSWISVIAFLYDYLKGNKS